MDDACAGLPESHSVARRGAAQEVIDFRVSRLGGGQVLLHAVLGADKVVAMDGGRHACAGLAGIHKLKHRHLGGSILHCNPVRAEIRIVLASFVRGRILSLEQVGIKDFLC